jgi:LPXTG-motif cell wall-anchored protein
VVHGRALARTGEVTLDSNTFTQPSCIPSVELAAPTTTTIAAAPVDTTPATVATTVPIVVTDITLPNTGRSQVVSTTSVGVVALLFGAAALMISRRRRPLA